MTNNNVQDNHYFERYGESLNSLLKEKDVDYARKVLQDLHVEIKRSRKIDKNEKQILSEKAVEVSGQLTAKLESTPNHDDELDHTDFEALGNYLTLPSWKELNPDNLSYPLWLRDVCIPSFFPLVEPELQNPIAAVISLINSNALPPKTRNMSLEAELPFILFVGKSGSGKSTFAEWIGHHYTNGAYQEVLGSSSAKKFRDLCDRACNQGHGDVSSSNFGKLRASYVLVDNFEAEYLIKWSAMKEVFIAVRRSQAVHGNSDAGRRTPTQSEFYSHCLKIATTVDNPGKVTALQPDMARRMLPIFFERKGKGLGGYSFEGLAEEYRKVWNRHRVKNEFFPLLGKFLSQDHELTPIPAEYYSKSVTILATGCYLGIWTSEKEALEHMASYWDFVEERSKDSTADALLISIDEYLEKHQIDVERKMKRSQFRDLDINFDEINARKLYDSVYDAILSTGVQRSRGKDFEKDVSNIMRGKGYTLRRVNNQFVFGKE